MTNATKPRTFTVLLTLHAHDGQPLSCEGIAQDVQAMVVMSGWVEAALRRLCRFESCPAAPITGACLVNTAW